MSIDHTTPMGPAPLTQREERGKLWDRDDIRDFRIRAKLEARERAAFTPRATDVQKADLMAAAREAGVPLVTSALENLAAEQVAPMMASYQAAVPPGYEPTPLSQGQGLPKHSAEYMTLAADMDVRRTVESWDAISSDMIRTPDQADAFLAGLEARAAERATVAQPPSAGTRAHPPPLPNRRGQAGHHL